MECTCNLDNRGAMGYKEGVILWVNCKSNINSNFFLSSYNINKILIQVCAGSTEKKINSTCGGQGETRSR